MLFCRGFVVCYYTTKAKIRKLKVYASGGSCRGLLIPIMNKHTSPSTKSLLFMIGIELLAHARKYGLTHLNFIQGK